MSIDDKIFTAEDVNITKAVHQCAKLLYPNFLKFRNLEIPRWKSLFNSMPVDINKMRLVLVCDPETLRKSRVYIEKSDILLIDFEGDQLGPQGEITLMQINTFENNICFLIDVKLLGHHQLKDEDGWLRKILESEIKVKFMWGATSDAANLWASYKIKMNCLVDLQILEVANRQKLIKTAPAFVDYSDTNSNKIQPINLENAYKWYSEDPQLLEFKKGQAQHKKDFHVWARRPINPDLLNYAAFDVASLRPLVVIFGRALKLWHWGTFEAATCRGRQICEPKVRCCFTCLRTLKKDGNFSLKNQRQISHCRNCVDKSYHLIHNGEKFDQNENQNTGLDVLDHDEKIQLTNVTNQLRRAEIEQISNEARG